MKDYREDVALWMMSRGYATGHGDTLDDLLSELVLQVWHKSRSPLYCYDPKTGEISLVNQQN